MSETITPIPILDSDTHFLTFQVRVGSLLVTIERSPTGLWIKLPGLEVFTACIDLWHMLPPDPDDQWDSPDSHHGRPQILLHSAAEGDSDDPIVRAIFSAQQTLIYTGDDAP